MPVIDPPPNPLVFEPNVQRFLVAHYPSNEDNTPPDVWDVTLYTYDCAITRARELMTDADNEGCCTITPLSAIYVFPPSPLVDGFPAS